VADPDLVAVLTAAYRPYVFSTLSRRSIAGVDGLEAAVDEGERWLEGHLTDLLSRPFAAQTRGPLEVFQEAMRFPTEALARAGVAPVERDHVTANALPGDVYDLAPASSRDLGEDVWNAHLTWGAIKAAALRRR
jgi:hypothetical protein